MARRSLRTALSSLRKELGDDLILSDRETLQLNPAFALWVDVREMEKQAREILANGSYSQMDADLYRGDLLQDFYEEWILEDREYYCNLFIFL